MIPDIGQGVRHTVLLVVQVGLMLTLCGFVLALAERHNHRYDLTPTQSFVLSEQARNIAAGLREPARIMVFYNGQEIGQRRQIADVLDQFASVTPQISYELYDLDRTPGLARKYNIASYNTGVVESRGKTHPLPAVDEIEIASGLLKLSRDRARALCFLTGHGEHSPSITDDRGGYSEVAKALEKEQFQIRSFDITPGAETLQDCTVAIVAGPTRELFSDEAHRLATFLDGGGKLLVLVDPEAPVSMIAFLQRFGARVEDGLVVDERNRLYGADSFMARVPIFDRETFHKNLDTAAVFPLARPITPVDPPPPGVTPALVALTSPESWVRIDGGTPTEKNPRYRDGTDHPGPVPVALMVTVAHAAAAPGGEKPLGRMAVFGDSDFASNFYLNLLGNKDLFMSMIGVLAEDQELVAVRTKGLPKGSLSPIYLTAHQGRMIFWLSVVASPGLAVLAGAVVAYWRRVTH